MSKLLAYQGFTVYLYRNFFVEPPLQCLAVFPSLHTLDLSCNQIHTLPPEIARLQALTYLDVRSNRLTAVPLQLGGLTRLAHLFLQRNRITSLPSLVLESCPFETLQLDGNPISPALERIYRHWTATSLDLTASGVQALPQEICAMPKVSVG